MSRERCRLEEGQIGSHWNTDYLLDNLSRKNHENVVFQKLEHNNNILYVVAVVFLWQLLFVVVGFFFSYTGSFKYM